ncbi:MAG: O-antigen ligase family protein [Candidatus Omnitrophota bacterium]|nr:O-antigen ligase family protein [Candidatus Omnitrophota bacterium]
MFNWLILIFVFLIPLENKTSVWLNFGGGINLTNIFIFLLIIIWIIRGFNNRSLVIKNELNFPIVLFILLITLSIFTGYVKLGISFFGDEFRVFKSLISTFLLFFIVANNISKKRDMVRIVGVISFMIVFVSLLSIKEFRGADIYHYDEGSRIELFGMQPNMLGAFFAQYIPIFAALFLMLKKLRARIFYLFLFSICAPGLMFTYSRGAYLGLMGALVMMAILGGAKSFRRSTLLIVFAFCAISLLFGRGHLIPVSVKERFDMIKDPGEDKSVALRKEAWALAKEYIRQSPLIGQGYGASDQLLYLESIKGQLDTHNMYLDIAMESGIPAVLVFMWMIIKAILTSVKAYRRTDDDFYKAICLGCIGSVAALAIGNYFGTRLTLLAVNGYFGILLGLVARIRYIEQTDLAKAKKGAKNNSKW